MQRFKLLLKWGDGNKKVMKLAKRYGKTVTFDLPSFRSADGFKVCPGAGACDSVCYAQQGNFNFPNVKRAQEHNLAFARNQSRLFTWAAVRDLIQLDAKLVRIHASGDMFSQAYLDSWFRIARSLPDVRFYCYSKSLHLDWSNRPKNLAVTFSEGGLWDDKIDTSQSHSRIFSTDYARRKAGYSNGSKTDLLAVNAQPGTKVGLIYHGTAKLTEAQKKYFAA